MKLKITNYGTIYLQDHSYFIAAGKVFVLSRHTNNFLFNKKGEKLTLPPKYYIELLKLETEYKKCETGIILMPYRMIQT